MGSFSVLYEVGPHQVPEVFKSYFEDYLDVTERYVEYIDYASKCPTEIFKHFEHCCYRRYYNGDRYCFISLAGSLYACRGQKIYKMARGVKGDCAFLGVLRDDVIVFDDLLGGNLPGFDINIIFNNRYSITDYNFTEIALWQGISLLSYFSESRSLLASEVVWISPDEATYQAKAIPLSRGSYNKLKRVKANGHIVVDNVIVEAATAPQVVASGTRSNPVTHLIAMSQGPKDKYLCISALTRQDMQLLSGLDLSSFRFQPGTHEMFNTKYDHIVSYYQADHFRSWLDHQSDFIPLLSFLINKLGIKKLNGRLSSKRNTRLGFEKSHRKECRRAGK